MTYFILANPNSGARKGERTLEQLIPHFEKNNINYRLFSTTRTGQEAELIAQILSEKQTDDTLIIIGGDGTLSLSIDALPADEVFSYIPAGSGNDFARSLGISREPLEAFEAIQKNQSHDIFIIKYASKHLSGYALNNIGIGLDAQIVKTANLSHLKSTLNKIKLGSFAYLITAIQVLFTKKPFSADVYSTQTSTVLDSFNRAFLMTFTKHPFFGGGVKISPEASSFDEKIHLVECDRFSFKTLFPLIPKVLKGTHLESPEFVHQVYPSYTITTHETQPVQIDGEMFEILAEQPLSLSTEKRTIIF